MRKPTYGRQTWLLMSSYGIGRVSTSINRPFTDRTLIWVYMGVSYTWLVCANNWLACRTVIEPPHLDRA